MKIDELRNLVSFYCNMKNTDYPYCRDDLVDILNKMVIIGLLTPNDLSEIEDDVWTTLVD